MGEFCTMLPIKRASGFGGDLIGHHHGLFSTISHHSSRHSKLLNILPWGLLVVVSCLFLLTRQPSVNAPHRAVGIQSTKPSTGNIFVSYSYFEKDGIQVRNYRLVLYIAASAGL